MQKITPFLWFDNNAEEAIAHYLQAFPSGRIVSESRGPNGAVFMMTVEIEGQRFMALNGGPKFQFTEAFSLFVSADSQAEVDRLWDHLVEGGSPSRCGWLKDRFGLSWQIVPTRFMELMSLGGAAAQRVMAAMFQMTKFDIAALEAAAKG